MVAGVLAVAALVVVQHFVFRMIHVIDCSIQRAPIVNLAVGDHHYSTPTDRAECSVWFRSHSIHLGSVVVVVHPIRTVPVMLVELLIDLTNRSFVDFFAGPTVVVADSSLHFVVVVVGRRMLLVVPVVAVAAVVHHPIHLGFVVVVLDQLVDYYHHPMIYHLD